MSRRSKAGGVPISLFSFQDLITSLSGILILLVLLMAVEVALRKVVPLKTDAPRDASVDPAQLRESVASLKQRIVSLQKAVTASTSLDAVSLAEQTTTAERKRSDLQKELARLQEQQVSLQNRLDVAREEAALRRKLNKPLEEELNRLKAALAQAADDSKVFYIPEEGVAKTPILVECSGSSIRVGFISRAEQPVAFATDAKGLNLFARHISQFSPAREYFVFMIKPSAVYIWGSFRAKATALNFDVGYDALEEGKSLGFRNDRP